jgi:hypothetical protein
VKMPLEPARFWSRPIDPSDTKWLEALCMQFLSQHPKKDMGCCHQLQKDGV